MTPGGRRRTSPKGGNRGMPRCRSGKLSGYGDLTGGSRARWRRAGDESADAMAPMRDGDDVRPDSGMTRKPRRHVMAT